MTKNIVIIEDRYLKMSNLLSSITRMLVSAQNKNLENGTKYLFTILHVGNTKENVKGEKAHFQDIINHTVNSKADNKNLEDFITLDIKELPFDEDNYPKNISHETNKTINILNEILSKESDNYVILIDITLNEAEDKKIITEDNPQKKILSEEIIQNANELGISKFITYSRFMQDDLAFRNKWGERNNLNPYNKYSIMNYNYDNKFVKEFYNMLGIAK